MYTDKELDEVKLSPTKKDYYQIWNELMEISTNLSNIWNPNNTNESDPGVVLLKLLTGVADKLSYNTDKKTLEHFMPSATQIESVRAMCENLGYSMKYYQSAVCDVNISFKASDSISFSDIGDYLYFPKFTNIRNEDSDVNFVTVEEFSLNAGENRAVACMEGSLVECSSDNDNIITLSQLDTQYRYFLPEQGVAENGIFVTNIINNGESSEWEQVDTLNTRIMGSKVYKFGFDSKRRLPYLQFTSEIANLIGDGLRIKYIRTNGYSGNVSANTLTVLEPPTLWSSAENSNIKSLTAENFTVSNYSAAVNGADPESIDDAYNNFKKTVGTFDTLVTCRDYMAAIYKMTVASYDPTPVVSNIIVSDVRDDVNNSFTLCSFNEYGINYSNRSTSHYESVGIPANAPAFAVLKEKYNSLYKKDNDGVFIAISGYSSGVECYRLRTAVDKFDIVLYPFQTVRGLNTAQEYVKSFEYGTAYSNEIISGLGENKTLAHNILMGDHQKDNIAAIKNYVRLKCKISTTKKVTAAEEEEILSNVYREIFANFNARKIDFGEEIPFDTIAKVIRNADSRIKDIMLDEPSMVTSFITADNEEYQLFAASKAGESAHTGNALNADKLYNKLALRNILAGRIAAFDYDVDFSTSYTETNYTGYDRVYPANTETTIVEKVTSSFNLSEQNGSTELPIYDSYSLKENEVVRFSMPNFKTTAIYPAYVNYYVHFNNNDSKNATPATMMTIAEYLGFIGDSDSRWENFMGDLNSSEYNALDDIKKETWTKDTIEGQIKEILSEYTALYLHGEAIGSTEQAPNYITKVIGSYADIEENFDIDKLLPAHEKDSAKEKHPTDQRFFKVLNLKDKLGSVVRYVKALEGRTTDRDNEAKHNPIAVKSPSDYGLYVRKGQKIGTIGGKYIDEDSWKYAKCTQSSSDIEQFKAYYLPSTPDSAWNASGELTRDGLGVDAEYKGEANNTEYQLGDGEYLLINYTDSTTDSDGNEIKNVVNRTYPSAEFPGPIFIKANFELIDSAEYHQTHSYSKEDKNGQSFKFDEGYMPDGMFTLGSNEQIEIREMIKVELNDQISNICWTRLDDEANKNSEGEVYFTYDEYTSDSWTEDNVLVPNAYTLKAGEYFYYTDSKKESLIYYGSGTTIKKHRSTPSLYKRAGDLEPSAEDVSKYGLIASLPWHSYNLSSTTTTDPHSLTLIENQSIVLTEGDKLIGLQEYDSTGAEPEGKTSSPTSIQAVLKTGKSTNVYSARYMFAESTMPENLPIAPRGITWKGTATLDINMQPETAQTLNQYDSITLHYYGTSGNNITFKPSFSEPTVSTTYFENPYISSEVGTKMTRSEDWLTNTTTTKSNVTAGEATTAAILAATAMINNYEVVVSTDIASGKQDKTWYYWNASSNVYSRGGSLGGKTDLNFGKKVESIKTLTPLNVFASSPCITTNNVLGTLLRDLKNEIVNYDLCFRTSKSVSVDVNGTTVNTYNYSDKWTKVNFANYKEALSSASDRVSFSLQTSIGGTGKGGVQRFGLIMFYYMDEKYSTYDKSVAIPNYAGCYLSTDGAPKNIKLYNTAGNGGTTLKLKPGINIVMIPNDLASLKIVADATNSSTLVFSPLDIITGINPKLDYRKIVSDRTAFDQLLLDMRETNLSDEFYYNVIISKDNEIDLNEDLDDELLSSPATWYDNNNINKKFVISEIDSSFLEKGITLTKQSKGY